MSSIELNESDDKYYFTCQISQISDEFTNNIASLNVEYDCPKTQVLLENIEDKNSNNSEEQFNSLSINNLITNEKHNCKNRKKIHKIKKTNCPSTTFTNKKRGRRKKNSIETDGHTAKDKDNMIRKFWIIFLKCILDLANSLSNPYNLAIKPTNFAQQFGPSFVENEDFIKLKFYQYYTYNKVFKDKKKNKDTGLKNKGVIKTMFFEKKDEIYIALMKSSIESMYNKYITNNKSITINGKDTPLLNFKTIDDIVEEEKEKLKGKNIEKELENFKNNAVSLVDYIKKYGEKVKRKTENPKKKEYITIAELAKEE